MFAKIWVSSVLVLALCLQVTAHAGVAPALGVQGNLTRGDVQRPTAAKPCGNVNIASNIGSSTPIIADASGSFSVDATCFNGGHDGSLKFTAKVDPTGTGGNSNFVDMVITTNGNDAPPKAETLPITAQLPSGINCQGNKCLVQFISGAGFGNCVVVEQSGAANTGGTTRNTTTGNTTTGNTTTGNTTTTTSSNSTVAGCSANTPSTKRSVGGARVYARHASGSLKARLLLAELKNRMEGTAENAKRDT